MSTAANTASTKIRSESANTVTLLTNSACFLWDGRKRTAHKQAAIGIKGLMYKSHILEKAIRDDDPYADWHFHRIEQAIQSTRAKVATIKTQLAEEAAPPNDRIKFASSKATRPIDQEYTKPGVLGFQAIFLLCDIDECIKHVIDMRHHGLMTNDESNDRIRHLERYFRSILHKSVEYRVTGVTRGCIAANNQAAARAQALMGTCPIEYVERRVYSPYAPSPLRGDGKRIMELSSEIQAPSEEASVTDS